MKAIVACDKNWGIGKGNDLLFHLQGDMAYFRTMTKDNIIIVGRKTLESFPNGEPLPNRINIVITHNKDYQKDGCIVCHSIAEAIVVAKALASIHNKQIFVCGGGQIYKMMMPFCDEILVTKVESESDADTFFPNLDKDNDFYLDWESIKCIEHSENGDIRYKYTKYNRIK